MRLIDIHFRSDQYGSGFRLGRTSIVLKRTEYEWFSERHNYCPVIRLFGWSLVFKRIPRGPSSN